MRDACPTVLWLSETWDNFSPVLEDHSGQLQAIILSCDFEKNCIDIF